MPSFLRVYLGFFNGLLLLFRRTLKANKVLFKEIKDSNFVLHFLDRVRSVCLSPISCFFEKIKEETAHQQQFGDYMLKRGVI